MGLAATIWASFSGDLAHLGDVGPADAILHGQPTGGPSSSGETRETDAWEFLGQDLFQLHVQALARRDVLCDDHRLAEEVVRQLHVERQVEADRAAPDIGAPARDIRIVLQRGVEALRDGLAGIDRRVLRQAEVDQQLRPVGRREELPRDQRQRQERATNSANVSAIVSHLARMATGEEASIPSERPVPARLRLPSLAAGRMATPSSGAKITATNQDTTSAMLTTANSENVYSPAELAAKPTGTKPAMVTSVPASMAKA